MRNEKKRGRKIFKDIRDGVLSYVFIASVYGSGRALSRPGDVKEKVFFLFQDDFQLSHWNGGFSPWANNTFIVVQYRRVFPQIRPVRFDEIFFRNRKKFRVWGTN